MGDGVTVIEPEIEIADIKITNFENFRTPQHFLKYLIEDMYNRDKQLYIRKTTRTDQVVTKDLTKSAVISTFQKKI